MTDEIGTMLSSQPSDRSTTAIRTILETLRNGHDSSQVLRSMLATANLSSEQVALFDTLLSLGADNEDEPDAMLVEPDGNGGPTALGVDAQDPTRSARQEIEDLRRANDALASALGACPICWGGNHACEVCEGWGRAGYAVPDPALFRQFVLPAVRRVRAMSRVPARHQER